jgi:hypothetical protein
METAKRKRKLVEAQEMVKATLKRIRRLNTSLKNWERRAKMHEKALAAEEIAALHRRIAELELRPRRIIQFEKTETKNDG